MWLLANILLLFSQSVASVDVISPDPVQVNISATPTSVSPGQSVTINVELTMSPGWHIYHENPGDTGKPTSVKLHLPQGASAGSITWEPPKTFTEGGFITYGYEGKTVISIVVTAPSTLKPGDVFELSAEIDWLACHDACVPGSATLNLKMPVVAGAATSTTATPPITAGSGNSLWYNLLLAFVGGAILNLMPCVLPVISFKVLGFAKQAGQERKRVFHLGLAYGAGTVFSFLVLAMAVIVTRQLGMAVGWGFQFQHPIFLLGMSALMVILSLSLFGVFYMTVNSNETLDKLAHGEGLRPAFFTGILATLLSTPCTAPFLGVALGFAFAAPWWAVIAIFASAGLGLAAPYVALTWNPAWLKMIPKPGVWMVRFKELLAFPMLITAFWLLSVLLRQTGVDAVLPALLFLLAVAFCTWLVGSFAAFDASRKRKLLTWLLIAAIMTPVSWFCLPVCLDTTRANVNHAANGEAYSEAAVQKHLNAGKVVLVDFTADWCLTCKVYEQTVLSSTAVQDAVRDNNVVVLRADWTNGDPAITAKLKEFGRSGVPLYVVHSPHRKGSPEVLPDIVTQGIVIDALRRAAKS